MRSFRHRHRQVNPNPPAAAAAGPGALSGGAVTVDPATVTAATVGVDNTHTSSVAGLSPQTVTITSSATPSSSSVLSTPSATPASSSDEPSHTAISTGAIIGIAVGIFGVLAVALVVIMTIRQRRRLRARSNSASRRPARKSWTRIDEPAPLQMRATNAASIADPNLRGGDESFLSLNSTRGLLVQPPPPSRNPFIAQPPSQQGQSLAPQLPPIARNAQDAHIPNPFTSPPNSPSHSPSPSHASTYSSAHAPVAPAFLSAPRAQTTSVATSFSDYPYSLTDPDPEPVPPSRFSADPEPVASSARLTRKPSSKAQDAHARARELRAMQDLISALDRRGAPPSAFPTVDTAVATGGPSRLSRGEGVVSPVSAVKEEAGAAAYWMPSDQQLPPADVFRAALNMGDRDVGRH